MTKNRKNHYGTSKRLLALALSLLLLTGLTVPVGAYAPTIMPTITQQTIDRAYALNGLGLFLGTENGFELERRATRLEGLVMLIRLLGEEQLAKAGTYSMPFADVPSWGVPYVGYAYEKGLTKGTSASSFGATTYITANDYATFALRALGYSDANGDFAWATATQSASQIGIVTSTQLQSWNQYIFVRGDMVDISFEALRTNLKGQSAKLYQNLVAKGIFTEDAAKAAGIADGTTGVLQITPATATCGVGSTVNLMALGTAGSVQWTSNSPNATVISSGPNAVVTGVTAGTATITATADGKSATATITITAQAQQAALLVNPPTATCPQGSTVNLSALVQNAEGTPLVSWNSDKPSVASVSSTGLVTGLAAGTAKITASVDSLRLTATATITVTAATAEGVTSVTLSQTAISLGAGDNTSIMATVLPADAANKKLTWSSSNPAVATVSDGNIKGIATGTATITATATDGSGKSASLTVTVTANVSVPTVTEERVPLSEGSYRFTPVDHPNSALDSTNEGTTNQTNVTIYPSHGGVNQVFNLLHSANAFYLSPSNTKDMAVHSYNPEVGANIHLWEESKSKNQFWYASKLSNGNYVIRQHQNPQLVMSLASADASANVQVAAFQPQDTKQQWKIERLGDVRWSGGNTAPPSAPLADGLYHIKRKTSGYALDVNGGVDTNGTKIQLWDGNDTTAQIFRLKNIGGAKYKFYPLCGNGKVLDINRGNSATAPLRFGLNANIWTESDPAAQEFIIEKRWDDFYTIALAALPNGVLTANEWGPGTQITLEEYKEGAHQHWSFTPTNEPPPVGPDTPPNNDPSTWVLPWKSSTALKQSSGPAHNGATYALDFALSQNGIGLYAPCNGTVVEAGWSTVGYGNYVMIQPSGTNYKILLAHMAGSPSVRKGDTVVRGQTQIGTMGSSGNSSGIHVHIEVRDMSNNYSGKIFGKNASDFAGANNMLPFNRWFNGGC